MKGGVVPGRKLHALLSGRCAQLGCVDRETYHATGSSLRRLASLATVGWEALLTKCPHNGIRWL
ncbi:hypothetical protein SAMN05192544_102621 [Paraburkholderia hospita]|nr:hypothetical protein SAMN05192544_102621 [Paraburkholderia hospita]